MPKRRKDVIFFDAPPVISAWGSAGGKKEGEGPLASAFDYLTQDAAFADGLAEKRQAPKTREEWDKYMFGRLYKAALKTVAINASRYPLVEQYCAWALQHGDIPKVSYEVLSPLLEHIREMKSPEGAEGGKDELPKVKMPEIDINKI